MLLLLFICSIPLSGGATASRITRGVVVGKIPAGIPGQAGKMPFSSNKAVPHSIT